MPERTDHNEAMRLADRMGAMDYEDTRKAAALLRQLSAERDQLRAEVERMRELLKIPVPSNHTHQCRVCLYAYTPGTDNEDCPRCGFDGADPSTSRTTHKETE